MASSDPLPHLLTVEELADHLGVTVRHVRRLIAERRISFLKVGRLVRFDPDDVTNWLAPCGSTNTAAPKATRSGAYKTHSLGRNQAAS
jgi:excisionase family DNA binding protein